MSGRIARLKRRPEFLRVAARGRRWVTPGFVLQAAECDDAALAEGGFRIGFTASRKVGNAVARNRARRRLRAAAEKVMPGSARRGYDYVLIARRDGTAERRFADLAKDLDTALQRVMTAPVPRRRHGSRGAKR